jgi:hypothetical protein
MPVATRGELKLVLARKLRISMNLRIQFESPVIVKL